MSELGVKVRSTLITAVYKQTISVSACGLFSAFSTGEVINFMSTDTDRVVNFSSSLHAAWSLPFQGRVRGQNSAFAGDFQENNLGSFGL